MLFLFVNPIFIVLLIKAMKKIGEILIEEGFCYKSSARRSVIYPAKTKLSYDAWHDLGSFGLYR